MAMRDALASAAQLPFQVAAALTDEVAHHVESLHAGHSPQPRNDSGQLYHENSTEMQRHCQEGRPAGLSSPRAADFCTCFQFSKNAFRNIQAFMKESPVLNTGMGVDQQTSSTEQQISYSSLGDSSELGNSAAQEFDCPELNSLGDKSDAETGTADAENGTEEAARSHPEVQHTTHRDPSGQQVEESHVIQPESSAALSVDDSHGTSMSSSVSAAILEIRLMHIYA